MLQPLDSRFDMRMSREEKVEYKGYAAYKGQTLSDFVRDAIYHWMRTIDDEIANRQAEIRLVGREA